MDQKRGGKVMSTTVAPKEPGLGIATQVFIGLGLGLLAGVFFGEKVAFLKIAGDAFIALLQITVIPYVMVALITSLGRLTLAEAKTLGRKGGGVLLVFWTVGLAVVLLSPLAFPDWPSASFFSATQIEEAQPVDFLQLYIPSNIFFAMSNAVVPAVVVFSILFGLALTGVRNKDKVLDFLSPIGDGLMTITGFVGRLAPYGVFAITASAAGTINIEDLGRLQVYIVVHVAMALILSLWLIPGLIAMLTPLKFGAVLRAFRGPLITAFATGSVLIVLPTLVAACKSLIAQAAAADRAESTVQEDSSVEILIPAAFPFPSLGTILALMFVLFGGWYIGSLVPISQYATLAVAGVASLFGGTVLAMPFLFDMLRLPADLFRVFITVDVIGSRFGTLLAAMHIVGIALIGTYAMQGRIRLRLVPALRFAAISVALVASAVIGIRAFYTYVFVEPYTKDQLLASLHRIKATQPNKVYREAPPEILGDSGPPLSLAQIRERGVLRACYAMDDYPSSFFNTQGELVGFDVEMTHQLARQLGLTLEFLPVRSFSDGIQRVNTRYCDVFMSLTPIVPELAVLASMTAPVRNVPLGLIVLDHRRQQFRTWVRVRDMRTLRILTSDTPAVTDFVKHALPNAALEVYHDKQELDRQLAAGLPDADAVLAAAEEGAAWTILHPQFNLVTPTPVFRQPFGYAVARGNSDLLLYLNTWLLNAAGDGTIDTLYRYWMLGQVAKTQPPRWSVLRNVLGWTK
jgi:Na+/H+-dicarboxylate symporter/ABC-type amino acid transport substrate-binding protein